MSNWFLFVAVTLEVSADNTLKPSLKVVYEVSMKSLSSAIMIIETQRAADTVCNILFEILG